MTSCLGKALLISAGQCWTTVYSLAPQKKRACAKLACPDLWLSENLWHIVKQNYEANSWAAEILHKAGVEKNVAFKTKAIGLFTDKTLKNEQIFFKKQWTASTFAMLFLYRLYSYKDL